MAKQLTDDELNIRRKARRRLVGAIALTLAVVVILPMVLDSEPRPVVQDIELRIPAPDKVGEFVPGMAASEVAGVSPFAVSAVEAAEAAAPASPPAATGNSGAEAQGRIQIAAPKQQEAVEPKRAAKPASGESFVAQVGAYVNPDTARQEADRLKKLGFKAYTEKAGDMVRVRVGPYAEREKAEKVRQMLEKHGLHPVVTSAKGS